MDEENNPVVQPPVPETQPEKPRYSNADKLTFGINFIIGLGCFLGISWFAIGLIVFLILNYWYSKNQYLVESKGLYYGFLSGFVVLLLFFGACVVMLTTGSVNF